MLKFKRKVVADLRQKSFLYFIPPGDLHSTFDPISCRLMANAKRKAIEMEDDMKADSKASPFIPLFEQFRTELDEHHDRRERIIKASRDITAQSKKM